MGLPVPYLSKSTQVAHNGVHDREGASGLMFIAVF